MQVLLLGINHQIQWVRIWSYSTDGALERFEQDQKDHFRGLLRTIIAERKAQFIGEETKHGEPSVAEEVCISESCNYANIEMTPSVRAELQIPPNYQSDPQMTQSQKAQFHKLREGYMFESAIAAAGDAESIIVICGRAHVSSLASCFRQSGHQVEETDIQAERWYIEDWMDHMLRL